MDEKCCVCEGQFQPGTLEEGKCVICVKMYPNAKNLEDAQRQTSPQKELMVTLTESRVREIAREEIAHSQKGVDVKEPEKEVITTEDQAAKMQKVRDAKVTKETDKKETE